VYGKVREVPRRLKKKKPFTYLRVKNKFSGKEEEEVKEFFLCAFSVSKICMMPCHKE
jgi:hypothetical protein